MTVIIHGNDGVSYNPETGQMFRSRAGKQPVQIGWRNNDGYIQFRLHGKSVKAHRIAWEIACGPIPAGMTIDHVNGDPSDNRLCNLRVVTHNENMRNRALCHRNKSGTPGVRWKESTKRWGAQIKADGRMIWLGSFTEREEAISVRRAAEITYGYHENHGRAAS